MPKILFITTSYEQKANSAAIRNNAWVNGLVQLGCEVTVLTVNWPKHMKSNFLMNNNKANIKRTDLKVLQVLKVTATPRGQQCPKWVISFRHFIRDIIFFPDVCKSWEKTIQCDDVETYDIVVSSSDAKSSHLATYELLKKTKNKPRWVQIWGDPWGSDINLSFIHKIPATILEKRLIGLADSVIYVSEQTKKYIQNKYPQYAEKIEYIPRGFYKSVLKQNGQLDKYTICYTGVLSNDRLDYVLSFIKAVEDWNKENKIKIEIEFYGAYDLDTITVLRKFSSCSMHLNVDYEDVLKLYASSDALLFISNGANSTQIPGKFFDYMGTQLPIVCILNESEVALCSILSQYERCVIANQNSNYKNIIYALISNKNNVYDINLEFSPKTIASKFLSILR